MPAARAGTTTTVSNPLTTTTPLAQTSGQLPQSEVIARFLAYPKVRDWLKRYPPNPQTQATFATGTWTVNVWSGKAGEIATGNVDDQTGAVTEAWTGPQVAWRMARGYTGAFGGTKINNPWIWGAFCLVFLIGLADLRRPLSVRNLDLILLLSPTASL